MSLFSRNQKLSKCLVSLGALSMLAGSFAPAAAAEEPATDPSATISYEDVPPPTEDMNTAMGAGERKRLGLPAEGATEAPGGHGRAKGVGPAATWTPSGGTLGMDVSSHQGNVRWQEAYNGGARFAYTKATEGTYYTNPYFAQQYVGSADVGMIRGAYHFANPRTSSGADQARYFVNHGGGWSNDGRTLPGLLDIEFNPYSQYGNTCYNLSPAQLTNWIRDFNETYRSLTGRYPMVYTANSWWSQCVGTGEFGKTLLHLANYNYIPGPTPNGWKSYDIWQFSADGPFVGDSNFFPGSFNDLKALASNPQATNRSWHSATPAPAPKPAVKTRFSDVPTHAAFYTEIEWLASRKITTGYGDGTFRPDQSVERGAMAAYFYRMAGSPAVNLPKTSPFSDVPTNHPFYKEIVWMHQRGITTGYGDGTFRPNEAVSREATAAFLYRYSGSPVIPAVHGSGFKDVRANNSFYREIIWLESRKITAGYGDGTFRPYDSVSRGAMAAFLYRMR